MERRPIGRSVKNVSRKWKVDSAEKVGFPGLGFSGTNCADPREKWSNIPFAPLVSEDTFPLDQHSKRTTGMSSALSLLLDLSQDILDEVVWQQIIRQMENRGFMRAGIDRRLQATDKWVSTGRRAAILAKRVFAFERESGRVCYRSETSGAHLLRKGEPSGWDLSA